MTAQFEAFSDDEKMPYSSHTELLPAAVPRKTPTRFLCWTISKPFKLPIFVRVGAVLAAVLLCVYLWPRPRLQEKEPQETETLRQRLIRLQEVRPSAWFDKMEQLAKAADFEVDFQSAFTPEDSIMSWVMERVAQDHIDAGRYWVNRSRDTNVRDVKASLWKGENWKKVFVDSIFDWEKQLQPNPSFNWSAVHWNAQRLPELGCSLSHYRIWAEMIRDGHQSVLSLEDDVDVEFHLKERWAEIEAKLPATWDAVFLGYCHSRENHGKVEFHPMMHKANAPWCTHAIAYSQRGAQRLLYALLNTEEPWLESIDAWLRTLTVHAEKSHFESYSTFPPLVVQDKYGVAAHSEVSDPNKLQKAPLWGGILGDGVLDRLRKANGTYVPRTKEQLDGDMAITRLSE